MPTFESKPIGRRQTRSGQFFARLTPQVRRHPVLLFGVPFVTMIVASSFGLSYMTQTRYDYNATKVSSMSKEEELGMRKDRRKIDIREEYFRLQAKDSELDDWEPKRIPRPEGMEEPLAPRSRARLHLEAGPAMQSTPSTTPLRSKSVILGPDGKPCRSCNSKLAFSAAMKASNGGAKSGTETKEQSGQAIAATTAAAAVAAAGAATEEAQPHNDCPPDGESLGQSTWTFLHSAAAYYPTRPNEEQQRAMLSLIQSLPFTYPCFTCAQSLGEELERERRQDSSYERGAPLQKAVATGPGLRKWLCGLHNEVNARLGKPTWTCNEDVLQQRWRDGHPDGHCD